MNSHQITVATGEIVYEFEVLDYVHHRGDRCEFAIYLAGKLVANMDPDANGHLCVCSNPGNIDENVLHLLADKIEDLHWHE